MKSLRKYYSYCVVNSVVSLSRMTLFFMMFSISSTLCLAESIKTSEEIKTDLAKIQLALEGYFSTDSSAPTAAIMTIARMSYSDIPDLLLDMTVQEIKGARKSRFLIDKLLVELSERTHTRMLFDSNGNIRNDSKLLVLQVELAHLISTDARFRRKPRDLTVLVEKAISNAKTKKSEDLRLSEQYLTIESLRKPMPKSELETKPHDEMSLKYKKFYSELLRGAKNRWTPGKEVKAGEAGPVEIILGGTVRFVTDEIAEDIEQDRLFKVIGREDILEELMMVLARYKQQNAVLLGSKGSGKTSIVDLLAEYIVTDKIADNEVTTFLKEAVILQTSSANISRLAKSDKPAGQADAMEAYFQALTTIQAKVGRRIIVFIDELHTLTKEQVESIKPYIESSKSQIMLIGASTSPEYRSAFKHNEAFLSRMQDVPVRELSEAEILHIFKESWMKIFKARHNDIEISEQIMKLIIRKSNLVYPDKGSLRASFHFADDLGTSMRYAKSAEKLNTQELVMTSKDVFSFIQKRLGLPVDPTDFVGMRDYRERLLKELSSEVFGQDRMVEDVVDMWMSVLRNESDRGVRVGMLMGRSGAGKTETATQLAVKALGSKERILVIKASDYANADDIKLSILFGVPGGVRFGEHSGGILMDWLDDPAKGKYAGVIVIDEAEKASPLFWIRLMELFDTGVITGGDNKTRTLNRHLVLLTSNRGDSEIYPENANSWTEEMMLERGNQYTEEALKLLFEKKLSDDDKGMIPDTILNRIDGYFLANLITPSVARKIGKHLIQKIVDRYLDRSYVQVEIHDQIVDHFIQTFEPVRRGARPMVRAMDRYIRNAIEKTLGTVSFSYDDRMKLKIGLNVNGETILKAFMNGQEVQNRVPVPRANKKHTCSRIFGT